MAIVKHRIVTRRMLVVSVVVGVVLAVASVPVASLAVIATRPNWRGYAPNTQWKGDIDRPDHVEIIEMHRGPGERYWATIQVLKPLELKDQVMLSRWIEPGDDPRPRYARRRFAGIDVGVQVYAYGWPMRAAYGRSSTMPLPSGGYTYSLDGLNETWIRSELIRFPLRPIWTGLVGNTAFYAAITLGLLVGVRVLRTRRRRARGRCVACGYELGDGVGVCPECGLGCS